MKLEINNELNGLLTTIAICAAIASVILGIGYMIYDHNAKFNVLLSQARTCEEKAVLMNADTSRIIACKIQIQPATVQGH